MPRALWLGFLLTVAGCSSSTSHPARQPDGGYRLSCPVPLSECLQRADRLCREQGYVVTQARDVKEQLGHEQGQSLIEIRKSEATIYSGKSAPPAERAFVEPKREPPSAAPAPSATVIAAPLPPPRACVPGATQACVGPAGCSGGQVCAPDGSQFQACDCGPAPAPAP
jgi:hypothetical protein